MAQHTVENVAITSVKSAGVTHQGNVYYRVVTDKGIYTTVRNGHINFFIQNYEGDSRVQPIVHLELTGWGTIKNLQEVNGDRLALLSR